MNLSVPNHHRRGIATLLTLLLPAVAQAGCDFSNAASTVQALLTADGISDGAVLIGSAQGIWFKQYFGSYDDGSVIPIASSSKLLSGTRIMQLVDQGVLALDTPVSTYLPSPTFAWNSNNAAITLRQMFSHTAGYGDDEDDPVLALPNITLQKSVQDIASNYLGLSPQNYLPVGSLFAYGGVSMQIGGEVAQQQSGVDWQQGWKDRIGTPLCVTTIDWQGLGTTQNYRIAGGAQTSLDDYARLLAMLAGGGVGNGQRILSAAALATLNHSQTGTATSGYEPPAGGSNTNYGVGAWIEPIGTGVDTPTISSIGAFGFTPWVDFSNGSFGLIMVADRNANPDVPPGTTSHAAMLAIVAQVRAQLQANGGSCHVTTIYDKVFVNNFDAVAPAPSCPGTVAVP